MCVTVNEIINEFKFQCQVKSHENITRFYGVTTDNSKKYLLVMEYANNGTLRNYMKEHFINLTWNDKLNLALQLARAVSYLHDEGILHHDLHSKNVLVHQGLREKPVANTPVDYVKIYIDCWNNEPDNRPIINEYTS
ncbi:unnamed protein product [Rhizophagus irregularis]|uniref:Protein kinase domain-containing protein n=1 Tax=Rhizophagus irregularis TaxID=588596 RepID=A0A915Z1P5_9GLOM|nr:unnamed protein product [Rhizophagus irregularis]CAB5358194.1 unnamed protein product [Rhizophagus irregularis]